MSYVATDTEGQLVFLCFMWRLILMVSSVFMFYVEIDTKSQSMFAHFVWGLTLTVSHCLHILCGVSH